MNKLTTLIIAIIVVAILAVYMVTFQVRYDQVAVLTTFEKADPPQINQETGELVLNPDGSPAGPGSLRFAGLHFKAPWPIQKVTTYSKRLQLLETQLEQFRTADEQTVIVKTFLAWRITDPYAFYKNVKTTQRAEEQLLPELKGVKNIISQYRFDQLVNTDESKLKLDEIEAKAAEQLRARIAPAGYGIEIERVGVRRLLLPEAVTQEVFERMKSIREARAARAEKEGEAEATTIRENANRTRTTILAFAEERAKSIEARGAQEATVHYKVFQQDPEFAKFFREMDALREIFGHEKATATFIMRTSDLDLLQMLKYGPRVEQDAASGEFRVVPAVPEGK